MELRRAPRWQLVALHRKAGDVVRALTWQSPRGRGQLGSGTAYALRRELPRTFGPTSHHAQLDRATGECSPFVWLRRGFRTFPPMIGATLWEVAQRSSNHKTHLLEKDIWVVAMLSVLFDSPFAQHLTLKGGTSLSKV